MSARIGRTLAGMLALGSWLLQGGCASSTGDSRSSPDAGTRTFGRLSVVLTVARDGAATVATTARLLRYRGVDVDSAQVLAGTPEPAREWSTGGAVCALVDDDKLLDDALATSPPDAAIQMLDAGDLLVRVLGQTMKVSPRYVPEIVPFVTGVVYDAESQSLEPSLEPMAEISGREEAYVAAFGGQQLGRFVAPADVPSAPRIESWSDADELSLTWTREGSGRGNVTIVVAGDSGPALRCQVADSGAFVVPPDAVARVRDAARGSVLSLSVERTRRTPFSAVGLDGAETDVTVRDVVTLR